MSDTVSKERIAELLKGWRAELDQINSDILHGHEPDDFYQAKARAERLLTCVKELSGVVLDAS